MLLQADGKGINRPACYFSRKFKDHQLNYSVIEKKAITLIWVLMQFDYVGGGSQVVVYSDHNPLTFLNLLQNSNQRLRWALFLQPYNLEIKQICGVENVMADALSRAPSE